MHTSDTMCLRPTRTSDSSRRGDAADQSLQLAHKLLLLQQRRL
jgi:hypothetical protein